MIDYIRDPDGWIEVPPQRIACFHTGSDANIDPETVVSFGDEWTKFDRFSDAEIQRIGDEYFDVVTDVTLPAPATALDLGCGGGRWSRYVASRCAFVEAVDPSEAVLAAHAATCELANVRVTQASVDTLPFPDNSFDFILCLGALHHIPDTAAALETAVRKLRPGGWMLLYIYYALENRGPGYRLLFGSADLLRRVVSRLPGALKRLSCDALAVIVYLPLVALANAVGILLGGSAAEAIPLHYYSGKSWRVIRNDALDRFGTPLEQRFTREEIAEMMMGVGLEDLRFSHRMPMWHVVGKKAAE
jgi:SAM-dependent methyltransferase